MERRESTSIEKLMTMHVFDAMFVFNYQSENGSHRWDNIPADLWWNLIRHRERLGICRFGLQHIVNETGLEAFPQLINELTFHSLAAYKPYHAESPSTVVAFDINPPLVSLLMSTKFDQWTKSNDLLPFDEVLFFDSHGIKVQAVPYENPLLFYALTEEELRSLKSIDSRFRGNLYSTGKGMRPL